MTTTLTLEELAETGEKDLGTSPWHEIDQARIDLFADATDDPQWIHVDPKKATKGPFGTTVAHGYLSLSLVPLMLHEMSAVSDALLGVNYGTEKIRFTSPVPVGSRIRLHAKLLGAERKGLGVVYRVGIEIEIERQQKPAVVGEVVFMASGAVDA